jgi:hypothetical protein
VLYKVSSVFFFLVLTREASKGLKYSGHSGLRNGTHNLISSYIFHFYTSVQ